MKAQLLCELNQLILQAKQDEKEDRKLLGSCYTKNCYGGGFNDGIIHIAQQIINLIKEIEKEKEKEIND